MLLTMFAVAARFKDDEDDMPQNGKMWEAGAKYVESARKILSDCIPSYASLPLLTHALASVRNSRPSVVQALVLLGYNEFGIGMELPFLSRSVI